jgi:hypothetical protein
MWQPKDGRKSRNTEGFPVVEGKHIAPFTVDLAAVSQTADAAAVGRRFPDRRCERPRLAYRDVSGVGNTHALIAAVLPAGVVTTHTLFCVQNHISDAQQHYLCGLFNSAVLNRFARLFMSGHITAGLIAMLPLPDWRADARQVRIAELAQQLAIGPATATLAELNALVEAEYGLTSAV